MGHIPEKHLKVAAPHLLRAYCTGTDAEKMTVEEQVDWVLSLENCAHGGIKIPVDIEDAKSSALICGKSIGDLSDHETKDEVVAEVSSEVAEVVAEVSSEVESKVEEEKTEDIKPKASKPKPKASKKSSKGKQS